MISKFEKYSGGNIELSYLALDWDDNILHMPTLIHMDKLVGDKWVPEDVSTSKFAEIRKNPEWRYRDGDATKTFCEFRDTGPRGDVAFLEDVKRAIQSDNFGPSWDIFIEYLSKGVLFAIVTARGHEPQAIKKVIEHIIDNILTTQQKSDLYSHCLKFAYLFGSDYDSYDRIPKSNLSKTNLIQDYLNNCGFYGISSTYCIKRFGLGDVSNPEVGKEMALKEFSKKVNGFGEKIGASVSMGFSDDDVATVNHIKDLFRNELLLTYAMKYNVYNTSDRSIKGGIRTKIGYNESSVGNGANTWGTDSSVLPFTKWNNMTKNLYPNDKDSPTDDNHNRFKNQMGQLGELNKVKKKDVVAGKIRKIRKNAKVIKNRKK